MGTSCDDYHTTGSDPYCYSYLVGQEDPNREYLLQYVLGLDETDHLEVKRLPKEITVHFKEAITNPNNGWNKIDGGVFVKKLTTEEEREFPLERTLY